jgi:hypothetical protein
MLLIEPEHFLFDPFGNPSIRRPPPLPMQDASIAFVANPFHQTPHLSAAQPSYFGGLALANLSL